MSKFLYIGLSIIVAIILIKFLFKGLVFIKECLSTISEAKEYTLKYNNAVIELNTLLQPYKDDLMKTEWGSKLFTKEGIINNTSVKEKGCAIIYFALRNDIKETLSKEDYDKYEHIIMPIKRLEHMELMNSLK